MITGILHNTVGLPNPGTHMNIMWLVKPLLLLHCMYSTWPFMVFSQVQISFYGHLLIRSDPDRCSHFYWFLRLTQWIWIRTVKDTHIYVQPHVNHCFKHTITLNPQKLQMGALMLADNFFQYASHCGLAILSLLTELISS